MSDEVPSSLMGPPACVPRSTAPSLLAPRFADLRKVSAAQELPPDFYGQDDDDDDDDNSDDSEPDESISSPASDADTEANSSSSAEEEISVFGRLTGVSEDEDSGSAEGDNESVPVDQLVEKITAKRDDASAFVGAVMGDLGKRKRKQARHKNDDDDDEEGFDDDYDDDDEDAEASSRKGKKTKIMAELVPERRTVSDARLAAVAQSLNAVGASVTHIKPLNRFPDAYALNRSHVGCELCRVGDSGRTVHTGVIGEIYRLFDTNIGSTPLPKIYEMMADNYNNHIRAHNKQARLQNLGQQPYAEWTYDMVQAHFNLHEVNHLKMLHETIVTIADKMSFTDKAMTYYEQDTQGKITLRHDKDQVRLWMDLAKLGLNFHKEFREARQQGSLGSRTSSAASAQGGRSSAMSGLTQNSQTRGASGFNNR